MKLTKETVVQLTDAQDLVIDPRWGVIGTGWGCTALSRPVKDDGKSGDPFWMITQDGGVTAPETMEEPVVLGLFLQDGEQLGWWECANLWEALATANGFHNS